MTAELLFINLYRRGVVLQLASGDLCCYAPRGIVTAELRDEIKAQKPALVALLTPDETLPDEIHIPASIPDDEAAIRACIDAQRTDRRAA